MSSTGCRYAVTVLCYITSHHIYHYTCTWNTKRPIVLWSEPENISLKFGGSVGFKNEYFPFVRVRDP